MTAEFDDGKDDGALRTIGEVSKALGIKTHVLRYWEQQFPMLDPLKRSGGRRYYRPKDVQLVERIDYLVNDQGYTLKGAKQVIEEGGGAVADAAVEANSKAGEPAFPPALAVDTPLAVDGGLANFFSAPEPPAEAATDDAAAEIAAPEPPRLPRDQIVARLKVIHTNLSQAIRA